MSVEPVPVSTRHETGRYPLYRRDWSASANNPYSPLLSLSLLLMVALVIQIGL
jgi:hypothetical protein